MNPTAHPTYFVVDVETTDLSPLNGHLLTVGIVVVRMHSIETSSGRYVDIPIMREEERVHIAIDQSANYEKWFLTVLDPASTFSWWLKQSRAAQDAAWRDASIPRMSEREAARAIIDFAIQHEPDKDRRVFTANPASFDYPWIDALFTKVDMGNPFPHRTLCLRSLRYGICRLNQWTPERTIHAPVIPHHALEDAIDEAFDLIDILQIREQHDLSHV